MSNKFRVGEIGRAILGTVAAGGFLIVVATLPGLPMMFAPFLKKERYRKRLPTKQNTERSINSLVRAGYIKQSITKGGIKLELTQKGKREAFILGLISGMSDQEPKSKKWKWDKQWRIVIFDIPENQKKKRNEMRKALIYHNFYQLQKSVWVTPYPCEEFVSLVKKYLGLKSEILYVIASRIENEKHLIQEFNL